MLPSVPDEFKLVGDILYEIWLGNSKSSNSTSPLKLLYAFKLNSKVNSSSPQLIFSGSIKGNAKSLSSILNDELFTAKKILLSAEILILALSVEIFPGTIIYASPILGIFSARGIEKFSPPSTDKNIEILSVFIGALLVFATSQIIF